MNQIAYREGPYHYASEEHRKTRTVGDKTFTLIISTAFNAYGLIGTEFNGILVLNDTDLQVVLDQELCSMACNAPTQAQIEQFHRLLAMDDGPFLTFCRQHSRFRGPSALGGLVSRPSQPFSWDTDCSYNPDAKVAFHGRARHQLRKLATHLGLSARDYDLRTNKAGIAVSGETTLHADNVYIQVSQSCMGNDRGILYRACEGRNDYTGGANNFAPLRALNNPTTFAESVRRVMRATAR